MRLSHFVGSAGLGLVCGWMLGQGALSGEGRIVWTRGLVLSIGATLQALLVLVVIGRQALALYAVALVLALLVHVLWWVYLLRRFESTRVRNKGGNS